MIVVFNWQWYSIWVDVIWALPQNKEVEVKWVQIPSKNVGERIKGGGFDERGVEPLFTNFG